MIYTTPSFSDSDSSPAGPDYIHFGYGVESFVSPTR